MFTVFCMLLLSVLVLVLSLKPVESYSDVLPHHYTLGRLKPFSGLPIPYSLTAHDTKQLAKGKSVIIREKSTGELNKHSRKGRGKIIQDIAAPPSLCMDTILDFNNYSKMVSMIKSLDIYNRTKMINGTDITYAKYEVGMLYFRLGYFLQQKFFPDYNTLTWTLDYTKDSDFDDNVGHWQVMSHPFMQNCSRVLFSTDVILPDWLPSFALKIIEKTALTESTGWLKRESEKAFKDLSRVGGGSSSLRAFTDVAHSYTEDASTGDSVYTPTVSVTGSMEEDAGGSDHMCALQRCNRGPDEVAEKMIKIRAGGKARMPSIARLKKKSGSKVRVVSSE